VIGQLGFGLVLRRALKRAADRLVGCPHNTNDILNPDSRTTHKNITIHRHKKYDTAL